MFDHVFFRLGAALLLGSLIGVERQWRQRTAGLRTNALVALGSAIFVDLAGMLAGAESVARVAAQVVTGVGFLGAGVIMKEGVNIRGLNTAATLWCSSAVGAAAGAGHLFHAFLAGGLVIAANLLLRPLALTINRRPASLSGNLQTFLLHVICHNADEPRFREKALFLLRDQNMSVTKIESADKGEGRMILRITLAAVGNVEKRLETVVNALTAEKGALGVGVEWLAEMEHV